MRSIHSLEKKKKQRKTYSQPLSIQNRNLTKKKRNATSLLKIDCKTVGFFFFSKSVKKSVTRGIRVLCARSARASHSRRACEASLPSLAICFQPRSRPFVWLPRLLEYAKIGTVLQSIMKNTPWKSNSFKRRCYQRGFLWRVATGNSSTYSEVRTVDNLLSQMTLCSNWA